MRTLFETAGIGRFTLRNRIIRAATADATSKGYVDDKIVAKYAALAEGGVGAIITGMTLVDGEEMFVQAAALCSDSFVSGHRKLTEATRRREVKIVCQLAYVGSYAAVDGIVAPAPSSVPNIVTGTLAREMRLGEIKTIRKKFADAACLAREAGYDGVEIHAAHGLLLSQFLTPHYNRRTDGYGGSIENRARMLLEVYTSIRTAAGCDFPIWVKLNSSDGIADGITEDDFDYTCRALAIADVDAIEVSGNWPPRAFSSRGAYFREAAERVADENNVPVILTGGNRKISEMTSILNESKVCLFGMARPFSKSPNLVDIFRDEFDAQH